MRAYRRPDHWSSIPAVLSEVEQVAATADVDLGDAFAEARSTIERGRRLRLELEERREDPQAARRRIAHALATGELDVDGAVAEAVRVQTLTPDGLASKAIMHAEEVAASLAFRNVVHHLDAEAVLEAARASATKAIEDVHSLRDTLAGVADGDEAAAAGPKAAAAWSRYRTELLPRWKACHELIERLWGYEWLPKLPEQARAFARYGRPDVAAAIAQDARRAKQPHLELLDPATDAAQPGPPATPEEALGRLRSAEQAEADAARATKAPRPARAEQRAAGQQ